ncbi:exodeoxyribonuclease V subunit alpha [Mycoplasmopsis canis UF31]|uniref:ATP-dependent DNA helicase n=1 Tax=Mycoplasmopsis canis TaxID=29555 RepID=UPI00025AD98A|nr:AAA family ATPase [Mycoplasmopsis canis]EIE41006.1 exodeoxyribonuclease V subunit alpha [Mycoplasmopsis canis UF31]
MKKIDLKDGEELLSGKVIKVLKGSKDQGWALFMFETETKEKKVVYAVKNIPDLYETYNLVVTKSTKPGNQNNYVLVNFYSKPKEVDREMELYQYLKNTPKVGFVAIDKIKIGYTFKGFFKNVLEGKLFDNDFAIFLSLLQKENIKLVFDENKEKIINLLDETSELNEDLFFFEINKIQNLYIDIKRLFPEVKDVLTYFKTNNPYKLYNDFKLSLQDVDIFGLALGWERTSFERLEAFMNSSMLKLEENNSTYWDKELLILLITKEANIIENKFIISEFIEHMINKNTLISVENLVCRKQMFDKERMITWWINEIKDKKTLEISKLNNSEIKYLSDRQREAYYTSLSSNINIITGGPGTGKSNIIKHIYQSFIKSKYKYGKDFIVLTPTGRASSNLTKKHGFISKTIHSFLSIPNEDERVTKDEDEFKDIKCLIIDEFSMVNINIFYLLLSTCRNLSKIILIGDVDQLPAIGPGNLLSDLINSQKFPVSYLYENFRSESSEIIDYIHFINSLGDFSNEIFNTKIYEFISKNLKLNINSLNKDDFKEKIYPKFSDYYGNSLKQKNIEMIIYSDFIKDLSESFMKKVNKYGIDNTIILCPTYRGYYGIDRINREIQNIYNKDSDVIHKYKIGEQEYQFRINDKVIQLVNRYDDNISNGDIGYIHSISKDKSLGREKDIIKVRYEDLSGEKIVSYTKEEFRNEIKLGYAVTIHKYQGSEIECAMFIVHPDHSKMLSKKLVYTAASRAIKKLVIFTKEEKIYSKIFLKEFTNTKEIITNLEWMLKE